MIKVLSIDQSSNKSGIAIGELNLKDDDWKLIHYELYRPKGKDFDEKLLDLCNHLDLLIEDFEIDIMLIEDVYALRNTNTLKKLANMQGALKELCNVNQVVYHVIHTSQWRTILNTRNKKRENLKQDSKDFVMNKFGLDISDDVADAICILTYYLDKRCE